MDHTRIELRDGLFARHRLLLVGTLVQQRTVRRRYLLFGEWTETGRGLWHLTDAERADLLAALEAALETGERVTVPALVPTT